MVGAYVQMDGKVVGRVTGVIHDSLNIEVTDPDAIAGMDASKVMFSMDATITNRKNNS